MSTRTRAILIVSIGVILLAVAVVAGVLLVNRINAQTLAVQQQAETVKGTILVMTRDMKLGDRISAEDVTLSEAPVDVIPRDAVTSVDAVVGKILKADVIQGEMLLQHNLADPTNNNHDLSFVLSDDHVLMAFPATDLMSRENVIQRGDIIDILATFQETVQQVGNTAATNTTTNGATSTEGQPVSRNFTVDAFQKVSITALVMNVVTDQNGNTTSSGISSYLLALDPQDALVLKHLKDMGANFDIVLRSPTSTAQFNLTPVTEEYIIELYGLEVLP